MINFHKQIAGGFAVGILILCVLAMSAPVSAKGRAEVHLVHTNRVALRRPFFWKAPQLGVQSEAVAPSPANQSLMPPALSSAIVASRFAT